MHSIMVFEINGQLFGYDTKFIKESVTVEKVFPVPNSVDYIKGIFNLRNNPIPLIDLGNLLSDNPVSSDVVMVLEKDEKICGVLIDKLRGVIQIEENKIFDVDKLSLIDDINKKFLKGYFEQDKNIVFLLNFDSLFNIEKADKVTKNIHSTKNRSERYSAISTKHATKGYIIFQIENEWFAVNVDTVQEILSFPDNISPMPDNPLWLKGMFLLRDNSVLLIDLPEFLGINDTSERERVILTNIEGKLIGIAVPYVKEIKWLEEKKVLPIANNSIKNKGIIPLENGKRLVLILDLEKMVNIEVAEEHYQKTLEEDMSEEKIGGNNLTKFLHFKVGNINMAIDIKEVQEVVEFHTINQLPKAVEYILGMMNLRNSVITVLSLEKKFNIQDSKTSLEDKRIIVLEGKAVSFLVDNLEGILSLSENDIFEPDESIEIEEKYLKGITKGKNDDLIFILDINNIINKEEINIDN